MDKFLSGNKQRVEYHQQEKGKKDCGRRHFPPYKPKVVPVEPSRKEH